MPSRLKPSSNWANPYGPTDTYSLNNLNQYTVRNSSTATYDNNGNLTTGVDGSIYTYDAQNRVLTATKSGVTETFKYDGLNRQVSRTVSGTTTYNVYDGWDLIEEYQSSGALTAQYLYGAGGLVKNLVSGNYYYQDGSGSSSHLADSAGHLLEWYRYDLQGTPVFYNFLNTQQPASAYGIRHLFTGQQWYSELGLYDLRNRFYSPDIGRFLQTDPIGFNGDASNLYRYCGNNPLKRSDPSGQIMWQIWGYEDRVIVDGSGFFGNNSTHGELNLSYSDAMLELGVIGSIGGREPLGLYERPDISGGHELPSSPNSPNQPYTPTPLPPSPPAFNPTAVDPSQVWMIDLEDSFSPSDWSNQAYDLQWSLSYDGNVVDAGTVYGITPRQAYGQTNQVGYATAAGMVPGQTATYNFVSRNSAGFYYNGWSATATVIDPWGIQSGALQGRINLQNQNVIPIGINLGVGGGVSGYLYNRLPASIQYRGYYYAVPGGG